MLGAGLIGTSTSDGVRRRRRGTEIAITATTVPASSSLIAGQTLNETENWSVFTDPVNYNTSAEGQTISGVNVNFLGDGASATDPLADGDLNNFSITVMDTAGNTRTFNVVPRTVTLAAPTVGTPLPDQTVTRATGVVNFDVAGAFQGSDLSFSVSSLSGVSIEASTGVISFDTDQLAEVADTPIIVTASNSGGSAEALFALTVQPAVTYTTSITGLVNNPTHGSTAQIGSVLNGLITPLLGTETVVHRWTADGNPIAGADSATYMPTPLDDMSELRYAPLVNGSEISSSAYRVRHAPPIAGTLAPVTTVAGGGNISVDLATGFSGNALTYSEGASWATISGATLSIDDAERTDTLTITATNSGGQAQVDLSVEIVAAVETDLVMTIETTTPDETFTLQFRSIGTYTGTVDMGDGSGDVAFSAWNDAALTGTYSTPGIHTVRARGTISNIEFSDHSDGPKIRTVTNLGTNKYTNMAGAFRGCTGMTSFVAGNADTSAVTGWFAAFDGCTALQTADISGCSFASTTNIQQMFQNCPSLTNVIGTANFSQAPLVRADETFHLTAAFDGSQLEFTSLNLENLSASGSLFNFLDDNDAMPQANYDAFLIDLATQTVDTGIFLGFGDTPFTAGGSVEAARTALINSGISIEDAGNAVPETPGAVSLAVTSSTELTATLPADPFCNGLQINRRDIRYSTDEANWTEVQDVMSPYTITGLTAGTLYYVQWAAKNPNGQSAFSASQTATTTASANLDVSEEGGEAVITTDGSGNVSVTIASGTYAGTYSQRATDSATLTTTMIEAAPTPLVLPAQSGLGLIGSTQTGTPALWIFDGADPGDPTFEWIIDGAATGDIDLSYTPVDATVTSGLILRETFGGLTLDSAAVQIAAAANAPDAFVDADWSVATGPTSTPNSLTITIASLPVDNGFAISDIEYDVNGSGTWMSLGTATTGSFNIALTTSLVSYDIRLRSINSEGTATPGNSETATSGAGVPSIVTDWTVTTGSGDAEIDIIIDTLPASNGSAITDIEYEISNSGTWLSLGSATAGTTTVLMAANAANYDIKLRAVNAVGVSTSSGLQNVDSGGSAAPSIDPEAGLIETRTFAENTAINSNLIFRAKPNVFAADFTGLTDTEGLICEIGSSGRGGGVYIDSGGNLVVQCGASTSPPPLANCASISVPAPTGNGTLVWEFTSQAGFYTVKAYWNGVELGTNTAAAAGPEWSDQDPSGFMQSNGTIVTGAPTTAVTYTTVSALRYYGEQSIPGA